MIQLTSLKISAYTRRRLFASVKLGFAAVPFSVVLYLVHSYNIVPGTFIIGFGFGFAIGIAELFLFKNWFKEIHFLGHLVCKAILFLGVMYLIFAALNLLDVIIQGINWQTYAQSIFGYRTFIGMLEGLAVIALLLFFIHIDRLLGPGILFGYVSGRYHRPRREFLIFMFLDLKASTNLAEKMDANHYFDFLQNYFREMSEPILETSAKIYQYVGDEIVLTWKMKSGLEEANCIRLFFLIEEQIQKSGDRFFKKYGIIPEFKAGIHSGEVITAQIGELKSEIVYSGDVLNTTARIQSLCNQLNQRLLISAEIMRSISLGSDLIAIEQGSVELRGKSETVELFAIKRRQNSKSI